MAVTTLTAVQLAFNTPSAESKIAGGTAIDAAKTMEVLFPKDGKLLLVINNTYAGAKVITVSAGDFTAKGLGAVAITCAQAGVYFFVPSSDQLKQSDGKLELSFEASTTGFVQAFLLP